MITKIEHIDELFYSISDRILEDCTVYLIGGGALMTYGLKDHTKDVDLVTRDQSSYQSIASALKESGFEAKLPEDIYSRLQLSNIYVKGPFRIDLFHSKVCGKLSLSEAMVERSKFYKQYGRIRLSVLGLEDILLFKTITDRDGDYDDCGMIAFMQIKWNSILEEVESQFVGEHEVWITYIAERLSKLSKEGVQIPILDSIEQMNDKFVKSWIKRMEEHEKDLVR